MAEVRNINHIKNWGNYLLTPEQNYTTACFVSKINKSCRKMAADLLYYTGAVGAAAALYTALLAACSSAALRRDLQECLGEALFQF